MTRPCFLVVDREHAGSISTRKLVLETAKLNVITAYSGAEALATFQRFPEVDGVITDVHLDDISCSAVVKGIKAIRPTVPVIVVGTPRQERCDGADHALDTFEPVKLLALITMLNAETASVQEQDELDQRREHLLA